MGSEMCIRDRSLGNRLNVIQVCDETGLVSTPTDGGWTSESYATRERRRQSLKACLDQVSDLPEANVLRIEVADLCCRTQEIADRICRFLDYFPSNSQVESALVLFRQDQPKK